MPKARAHFGDGSPATTVREVGNGLAMYCSFLPGLSYFKPAIPRRPVDRGSTDDAMTHFLPTRFDPGAAALIASTAVDCSRPVDCSEPLVETTVIESKHGVVIPLVNWSGRRIENLEVVVRAKATGYSASLAGGSPVTRKRQGNQVVYTMDLDVADALVFQNSDFLGE